MAHSCSPKQPNRPGRAGGAHEQVADETHRVAASREEGVDVDADDVARRRRRSASPAAARRRSGPERDPGARVPATQLGRLERVVGEEEVLDGVLPVVATAGEVRGRRGVDARLVRRRPLPPLRLVQDLHPTRVGDWPGPHRRTAGRGAGWPHGTGRRAAHPPAAPPDLLLARARVDRGPRRRPARPGPRAQRRDAAAALLQAATTTTCARVLLPAELPASLAPATAVLAGTADVAPSRLDLAGLARLLLPLVRGHPADCSPGRRGRALPRRGVGGGAVPARALRRRAAWRRQSSASEPGLHWYDPEAHALVARRSTADRRRRDGRRHRGPVAHGLALPRARLPPHLLGCRHDARADPRPRRLGGHPRAPLHDLPRRRGGCARRRRPRPRVPRGARRRSVPAGPALHPTGDPIARPPRRRRARVPARHGGTARGGAETPSARSSSAAPRSRVPSTDARTEHRRGRREQGLDPPAAPRPALPRERPRRRDGGLRCAASTCPHWVGVSAVDDVPTGIHRWPDVADAGAPARRGGQSARSCSAWRPRAGPRPRRLVRRHERHRPGDARRPRLPRGPAARRARRGPAPPHGVRVGRGGVRHDLPRLRPRGPARAATSPACCGRASACRSTARATAARPGPRPT